MDRFRHDPRGAVGAWSAAVVMLVAIAGCNDADDVPELTDFGRFSSLVSGVSGAMEAGDFERATRFELLFVEGAAPPAAERSKYGPPTAFQLAADPEISGDTATLAVNVLKVDENERVEVVGQTKWTAVKVDGMWKLKDVRLP